MEYIDKLKIVGDNVRKSFVKGVVDTVYSVQNSVRDVLPGNPLTREYEVSCNLIDQYEKKQILKLIGNAGPKGIWQIYSAIKKSTKEEASIMLINKNNLSPRHLNNKEKNEILNFYRQSVQQLTRLKHPRLLSVQHQLEESKDSIAFAVEPLSGSLNDLMKVEELSDIEIRYGIMQLCEALKFLHNDGRILHGNVCPETILISDQSGMWKLGCFEFATIGQISAGSDKSTFIARPLSLDNYQAKPNMNYLAMEYTNSSDSCPVPQSDMFSIGSLLFTLYNNGNTMFDTFESKREMKSHRYKHSLMTKVESGEKIPQVVKKAIKILISSDPTCRPSANDLLQSALFEEVSLRALEYLDSLFQVDNLQRSIFYKTLLSLIPNLPKLLRLMNAFEVEFVNADMLAFIMPNIFLIASSCSNDEFDKFVLPKLKIVFRQNINITTLVVIMENMSLLLQKTNQSDIKDFILPVLYNAMDANSQQIQDMCLSIIPSFGNLVDSSAMRTSILPRIKRICINTTILSVTFFSICSIVCGKVRVNCLLCLGKLCERFDRWTVVDNVLPILEAVPSKEPAVLMAILGVIKIILDSKDKVSKESLASKFIPLLLPLSLETGLNENQFDSFFKIIRHILHHIETEQRIKIKQLQSQTIPSIMKSSLTDNHFNISLNQTIQQTNIHLNENNVISTPLNTLLSPSKKTTQPNIDSKIEELINSINEKHPKIEKPSIGESHHSKKTANDHLTDLLG